MISLGDGWTFVMWSSGSRILSVEVRSRNENEESENEERIEEEEEEEEKRKVLELVQFD